MEDMLTFLPLCVIVWGRGKQTRLEIMGKKAKNAMFITGTDAEKIAKEIAKVEKRRVVKSTSCNERSSRSHCLVTHDLNHREEELRVTLTFA